MIRSVRVEPTDAPARDLAPAVAWLRAGGIVAFPTDTLYGLAVNPRSSVALDALFDLKGRPSNAAIPLLAGSIEQVHALFGELTGHTRTLADAFWPGPLSLILDRVPTLAPEISAGSGTVAVRVPAHDLARAFAEACGHPITATSANRSGEVPASDAADLGALGEDERVFVIDGGRTPGGAPSTIVDARHDVPQLVREGAIAWDRVLRFLH